MLTKNISADTQTLPLLLNVSNTVLHVTPSEFDSLCLDNPDLRLELSKDQELIVMSPTGGDGFSVGRFPQKTRHGESGEKNGDLIFQVIAWNRQTKLGRVFDSSTGYNFISINGGKMSPDVSWIEKSRLDGIDITGFIPVVPDFVIELRSATDRLNTLQNKMLEYQLLGVKLALLINPQDKQVEVYRLDQETEILDSPIAIDCQLLMPGFNLDLTEIL